MSMSASPATSVSQLCAASMKRMHLTAATLLCVKSMDHSLSTLRVKVGVKMPKTCYIDGCQSTIEWFIFVDPMGYSCDTHAPADYVRPL